MMNNGKSAPIDDMIPTTTDLSQILHFRKIWKDAMEGFEEQVPDVPDVADDDQDTAEQKLRAYVLELQELIAVTEGVPATNIFDRCLGVQRWHIGKALLLLKPLQKGERGFIKHGEWKPFLDAAGLDEIMAWRCRAVADNFPGRQDAAALSWQWTTMIDALPTRKRKSDDDQSEDDGDGIDEGLNDDPESEDGQDGEDLIEPIGNYMKRLSSKADDLLAATDSALKIVEAGKSDGLTFSAAREAAGFKSFVPQAEAIASTIYKSVVNLYRLASLASESEVADIRGDLEEFLKRHRQWQGEVKEDVE